MKIQKIKFKNIHSLKGENCIDFMQKPLVDTGIFAIIGPTGSGKSTILDVIMLAIYGQMPRLEKSLSKSTIEKYGAVLTHKTNEAYAEVEYEMRGVVYRSKWSIRRNKNGNLNDYDMELANVSNGNELIETYKRKVPTTNEKIIGLKYDQFLKSIVLAQGSFSKFLKAKPEERTEMLEQITGSWLYRNIGVRAFEMAKKHREKYEENEKLLENYNVLSDEERQLKMADKNKSEEIIVRLTSEIEVLNEKIKIKKNVQKLLDRQKQLDIKLSELNNKIADFKATANKLQLHDKIINLKSDLIEHQKLQKNITEVSSNLQKIITEKKYLLNKKTEYEKEIALLQSDLDVIKSDFQNNSSAILTYREKKSEYEVVANEKNLFQKNLSDVKNEFSNLNKTNDDLINRLQVADKELVSNKKWVAENFLLEQLATDYVKIEQTMQNYLNAKNNTSDFINKSSFKNNFQEVNWSNYQDFAEKLTQNFKANILSIKTKIGDFSSEELKTKYDKIILEIPIIQKQLEIAENYKKIYSKLSEYNRNIEEISATVKNISATEEKTRQQLEINAKLIEELRIRYERQQLEAKYEQARKQLKAGEECPLCGSVSHPYIEHDLVVEIDKTKLQLQNYEKKQKNLEKDLQKIISELSNKKSTFENWTANKNELEIELNSIKNIFSENNKKLNLNFDISDSNKITETNKKVLDTKKEVEDNISRLNKVEKLRSELQILENISEKINSVFDFHLQTKKLLSKYTHYYKGAKNSTEILQKLDAQNKYFQKKVKDIDKLQNEKSTKQTILEQNNLQLDVFQQRITEFNKKLSEISEKEKSLKDEILFISKEKFEDKTADEYENFTRKIIDNKTNKLSELNNKLTKILTKNDENNKQIEILSEKNSNNKILFTKIDEELKLKLATLNISSVQNALETLLNSNEAEAIRTRQKELSETQYAVNQSIKENNQLLKIEIKNDTETLKLAELQMEVEQKEITKQAENQQIGSINTILETDKKQKEKLQVLKAESEKLYKEFTRWEALNKLIGDAKGKKFAEIAHQFTLSELISISNKHLKRFSNRYLLDKTTESKNNLFVYDTYMGMAKRSVQTLSGGETFLVSLSMALALSDLASKQTKIESLFIDEGFGTLDEQTLDNALVKLEKLHSDYNRTIGIISHVAEIKERINTKIVVKKQNSGFSKIEIL